MIVKFLDKLGNLIKSFRSVGVLTVDAEPVEGSNHLVASGGVAEAVEKGTDAAASNLAPEYSATSTYAAGSYVIHDGILYTNPNAIGTAEAWTPAHWTQTTVAEMMAGASAKWTKRNVSLAFAGGDTKDLSVQDHEIVNLTTSHTGAGYGTLNVHLTGECYILLDKGSNVMVKTYVGDGTSLPTTEINTSITELDSGESLHAVVCVACGISVEWNPDDFGVESAMPYSADLVFNKPSPTDQSIPYKFILHSLGDGTLFVTPLP